MDSNNWKGSGSQSLLPNVVLLVAKRAKMNDESALMYLDALCDQNVMSEIIKWMIELAEQGDIDAQYNLGLYYKQAPSGDDKEAAKWFTKAAENGHILSCWNLGMYYEYGLGDIEKDVDKAIEWYTKVANSTENYAVEAELKLQKMKDLNKNN